MIRLLKNVSKLASLFLLLLLSFIYTDKVFTEARNNDPIMKEVMNYKKENDIKPIEPKIRDDEIILGLSGLEVDAKRSYKNMKDDTKFDKEKLIYNSVLPKTSISKTYDYYITKGNDEKEEVSIIFKVSDNTNVDEILSLVAKTDVKINFFVDGAWLEKNVETAFSIVNLDCEIYNLGYDGVYTKNMISVTNNLIESVTLKDSNLCLNETKDDDAMNICKKRKMHTITPTITNPSITDLKKKLDKGIIISYDLSNYDYSKFKLMINTITSRGYEIKGLSSLISENN